MKGKGIYEYRLTKKRIKSDEYDKFLTQQYLDECNWADFNFLGRYKGEKTVFCTTILSTRLQFQQELSSKALEMMHNEFPDTDFGFDHIPTECGEYFQMVAKSNTNKEYDWEKATEKELYLGSHTVSQGITRTRYGAARVGLEVVMNVEYVTQDVIEKFIEDFTTNPDFLDTTEKFRYSYEDCYKVSSSVSLNLGEY